MKLHEFLPWLFAGLFLLTGLLMAVSGSEEKSRQWAAAAALCLAGFSLSLGWNAWVTGEINLRDFHYRRAAQPRRFYTTLAMLVMAGLGVLILSVLFLLGRL